MSDIFERAESAIARWRAGSINHALHLELAELVAEFHALFSPTVEVSKPFVEAPKAEEIKPVE